MSYWLCSATSSLNTKMERVGGRSTQGCLRFFLKIFRGLLRGNSAAPQRSCLKKHTLNSTLYVPTWESAIPARQQRKSSLICDWVRNNYLGLGLQRDVSAANIIHGSLTCYLSALSRWAFTVWCEHRQPASHSRAECLEPDQNVLGLQLCDYWGLRKHAELYSDIRYINP